MIAVFGLSWLGLLLGVKPELVARIYPYLASGPQDSYAFVTGRVEELAARPISQDPVVVVLGGSGLRYAISRLPHFLAEASGREFEVCHLLTDDQSVLETASLLDELPESFNGVVVVDSSHTRLASGLAKRTEERAYTHRLGFRSRSLELVSAQAGRPLDRSSNYFWDNRDFFLPRLWPTLRNLWTGPPPEFVPKGVGGLRAADGMWDYHRTEWRKYRLRRYRALVPQAMETLLAAAARVRQRGRAEVALVQVPVSPQARTEIYGPDFCDAHEESMGCFAGEAGLHYWSAADEARLEEDDFFDWIHLNNDVARERYTRALAVHVAAALAALE